MLKTKLGTVNDNMMYGLESKKKEIYKRGNNFKKMSIREKGTGESTINRITI